MSGIRQAIILGAIPIAVGLFYLLLQVAFGQQVEWLVTDGVELVTGTVDPAGVILLLALGLAMGFGMLVILRGARDL